MTRRKPPGTSMQSWIDRQIREAEARGDFDDLPGKGKPLRDLDEVYDPGWWTKKLIQREEISVLPPALEIRRKVERELEAIGSLRRESKVRAALEKLNAEIARVNAGATSGPPTDVALLDVDAIVESWREGRSR